MQTVLRQLIGASNADPKQTSTYLNVTQVGLDSMRRFGTQPLHSGARDHESEHPPTGNAQPEHTNDCQLRVWEWRACPDLNRGPSA